MNSFVQADHRAMLRTARITRVRPGSHRYWQRPPDEYCSAGLANPAVPPALHFGLASKPQVSARDVGRELLGFVAAGAGPSHTWPGEHSLKGRRRLVPRHAPRASPRRTHTRGLPSLSSLGLCPPRSPRLCSRGTVG